MVAGEMVEIKVKVSQEVLDYCKGKEIIIQQLIDAALHQVLFPVVYADIVS